MSWEAALSSKELRLLLPSIEERKDMTSFYYYYYYYFVVRVVEGGRGEAFARLGIEGEEGVSKLLWFV